MNKDVLIINNNGLAKHDKVPPLPCIFHTNRQQDAHYMVSLILLIHVVPVNELPLPHLTFVSLRLQLKVILALVYQCLYQCHFFNINIVNCES